MKVHITYLDLENELRQTQNTEHIQHLNSVLRDQDELIVSLTDKVEMYKKMHSMTVAELEVWKNTHNTAYTDEEIQKLINEKNELQKQKVELKNSIISLMTLCVLFVSKFV
jgi:predicted  nucleic acid-binding Zn-ribbon protein